MEIGRHRQYIRVRPRFIQRDQAAAFPHPVQMAQIMRPIRCIFPQRGDPRAGTARPDAHNSSNAVATNPSSCAAASESRALSSPRSA